MASFEKPQSESSRPERVFGKGFLLSHIKDDMEVPVGGTSVFTNDIDIAILSDYEKFDGFFTDVREAREKIPVEPMQQWLDEVGTDIAPELFAQTVAFSARYAKRYPEAEDRAAARRSVLFGDTATPPALSEIVTGGKAECAEIATLAQGYFQRAGIDSTYVNGEVLHGRAQEFAEPHAYLVLRKGGKTYIYDPANPLRGQDDTVFPNINETEAEFLEILRQGRKCYVAARNVLVKGRVKYYGVGNGTNVSERDLVGGK